MKTLEPARVVPQELELLELARATKLSEEVSNANEAIGAVRGRMDNWERREQRRMEIEAREAREWLKQWLNPGPRGRRKSDAAFCCCIPKVLLLLVSVASSEPGSSVPLSFSRLVPSPYRISVDLKSLLRIVSEYIHFEFALSIVCRSVTFKPSMLELRVSPLMQYSIAFLHLDPDLRDIHPRSFYIGPFGFMCFWAGGII